MRRRALAAALLLGGLLAWTLPAAGAPWTLRLNREASLPAGPVRLRDVAPRVPAEAGALLVHDGGRPGEVVQVDRRLVLRRLSAAGLAGDVRLAGATACRVRFRGRPVSADALEDWLREALAPWTPAGAGEAPATWLELEVKPPRAAVGPGAGFELVEPRPLTAGRNLVPVRIRDGGQALRLTATVRCHVFGEVARAVAPVARGTVLLPGLFAWEWRDLAATDHGLVVGRAALAGRSARRDVEAGAELRDADLKETPLVRQGQTVELELQRGAVLVAVPCTARQEGCLGQVITVRNAIDGKLLPARVVAPGRVVWGR